MTSWVDYWLKSAERLTLPQLGNLEVVQHSADPDLASGQIYPPKIEIVFKPMTEDENSYELIIPDCLRDTPFESQFRDEYREVIGEFFRTNQSLWSGLGAFQRNPSGTVSFQMDPDILHPDYFGLNSIPLKPIRKKKKIITPNTFLDSPVSEMLVESESQNRESEKEKEIIFHIAPAGEAIIDNNQRIPGTAHSHLDTGNGLRFVEDEETASESIPSHAHIHSEDATSLEPESLHGSLEEYKQPETQPTQFIYSEPKVVSQEPSSIIPPVQTEQLIEAIAPPKKKNALPAILTALAFLVLLAVVFLIRNSAKKPIETAAVPVLDNDTVMSSKTTLAESPTEDANIATDPEAADDEGGEAKVKAIPSKTPYGIVIGSFRDQRNIQKSIKKLTDAGYPHQLIPLGNGITRVIIPLDESAFPAESTLQQIRATIEPNAWLKSSNK